MRKSRKPQQCFTLETKTSTSLDMISKSWPRLLRVWTGFDEDSWSKKLRSLDQSCPILIDLNLSLDMSRKSYLGYINSLDIFKMLRDSVLSKSRSRSRSCLSPGLNLDLGLCLVSVLSLSVLSWPHLSLVSVLPQSCLSLATVLSQSCLSLVSALSQSGLSLVLVSSQSCLSLISALSQSCISLVSVSSRSGFCLVLASIKTAFFVETSKLTDSCLTNWQQDLKEIVSGDNSRQRNANSFVAKLKDLHNLPLA